MHNSSSWRNAPLILVVAQVVFDKYDQIEEDLSNIQMRLAEVGFFSVQDIQVQEANFDFQNVNLPQSNVVTNKLKQIFNDTVTRAFVFGSKEFSFIQSDYTDFETFIQNFEIGIEAISKFINLPMQRIGLRYIDLLENQESLHISDQINSSLRIMKIENQNGSAILLTSIENQSQLTFQLLQGQPIIPHLQTTIGPIPKIDRLSRKINVNDVIILDFDVMQQWAIETPNRPKIRDFKPILVNFHERASRVFQECLTKEAIAFYRDGLV
jgi:uncharacterized protein (TIGR04255 family)